MTIETFQNQPVVKLASGDATALVSPSHGGKLLKWQRAGWTVIDWPANADWDLVPKVRGGDPLLFPFIARTFCDGRIGRWRDARGIERPAPMHGFAKDFPFRIVDGAQDFTTLRLEANELTLAVYPFPFRLDVTHRLTGDSLETTLTVSNTGTEPMPWTAGHHYYFHVPAAERPDWTLTLPCAEWGHQDFSSGEIALHPAGPVTAPISDPAWIDRFQFRPDLRAIRLSHPKSGRSISFDAPDSHLAHWICATTWTEAPDSDFFCIEPWSAFPNAIHSGLGLQTLPPGETTGLTSLVRTDIRS